MILSRTGLDICSCAHFPPLFRHCVLAENRPASGTLLLRSCEAFLGRACGLHRLVLNMCFDFSSHFWRVNHPLEGVAVGGTAVSEKLILIFECFCLLIY